MLPTFTVLSKYWFRQCQVWRQFQAYRARPPLNRPDLATLAQSPALLPEFVAECAVARKYLELLGPLDWANFPERRTDRPWPGSAPVRRAPFVAAYLVKLNQNLRYMSDLQTYLVEHPALVWVLGFKLVPDPNLRSGFDVAASMPSA